MQDETNLVKERPDYKQLGTYGDPSKLAQEAWDDARTYHRSFLGDLLTGQLHSTVECLNCGTRSHKFETFGDMGLAIDGDAAGCTIQVAFLVCCWCNTSLRCLTTLVLFPVN